MARILNLVVLAAAAYALPGDPPGNEFLPPSPTAERCACPYLNTLANHGYVNRAGIEVTRQEVNNAFEVAFNVDPVITDMIFSAAIAGGTTSTTPDTLNYVDLNQHGLIEHDGSLSRDDAATGNNFIFNQTIWDEMTMFFTDPLISIEQMATARVGRLNRQRAANPVFRFDEKIETTSLGETSLVMLTFSNGSTNGGANRQLVDTFFTQERLPFDQGYTVPTQRITAATVQEVGMKITTASGPGASFPAAGTSNLTATMGTAGSAVAGSSSSRTTINMAVLGVTLPGLCWSLL